MKVFVIEDNPVYNDYVCNLLKKDSFDTMSAYNLGTRNIRIIFNSKTQKNTTTS